MPALTEEFLRKRSGEILIEKTEQITIFDTNKEKSIPRFTPKEIEFGQVLGKGGFCTVSTLDEVRLSDEIKHEEKKTPMSQSDSEFFVVSQDRQYISDNFIRERDGKHRYAIKTLTPGLFKKGGDPQHFVSGVIDLAMEVKFLSILRHPHIIKMRAMANVDHCSKDFFILLDRLNVTLTKKIDIWKKEMPTGFGKKEAKEEFFCERLIVGYDICSAVAHLHEHNIVYRDLKPDNIGFDVRDDVKIFDFGLATELVESRRVPGTDNFNLTKDTGSPRYMAPEVYQGLPYNTLCDVYSYGLILWQILELTPPFEKYDVKKMTKNVWNGKDTPKLSSKWSTELKEILSNMWLRDFNKRHSCHVIMENLRDELRNYDGDALGELDASNKTEKSIEQIQMKKLRL